MRAWKEKKEETIYKKKPPCIFILFLINILFFLYKLKNHIGIIDGTFLVRVKRDCQSNSSTLYESSRSMKAKVWSKLVIQPRNLQDSVIEISYFDLFFLMKRSFVEPLTPTLLTHIRCRIGRGIGQSAVFLCHILSSFLVSCDGVQLPERRPRKELLFYARKSLPDDKKRSSTHLVCNLPSWFDLQTLGSVRNVLVTHCQSAVPDPFLYLSIASSVLPGTGYLEIRGPSLNSLNFGQAKARFDVAYVRVLSLVPGRVSMEVPFSLTYPRHSIILPIPVVIVSLDSLNIHPVLLPLLPSPSPLPPSLSLLPIRMIYSFHVHF